MKKLELIVSSKDAIRKISCLSSVRAVVKSIVVLIDDQMIITVQWDITSTPDRLSYVPYVN